MPERAAKPSRMPVWFKRQKKDWKSFWFALGIHSLLVLMLVLGLDWKTEKQGPLQVELFMAGDSKFNPPPQKVVAETKPAPETPPDPKPDPKPEPTPEPESEVVPPPPPPTPTVTPKTEIDPEIALEQERKRKLEQERIERELAEKKAKEEARKEQERLKREKELAEKKEKEKIEKERKEIEKKAREEAEKKAAAEKKVKEEAEKKAKEEAEKKAKAEAEKKAKAEAAKKAAADKALKDAFRNDALGTAGSPSGTADRNQVGGANDNGYSAAIMACIKPGVNYPVPPRSGNRNPTATYRVQVKSDNTIGTVKLVKSSGISRFDEAVEAGIKKCSPLPNRPPGYLLQYFDLDYQMYD